VTSEVATAAADDDARDVTADVIVLEAASASENTVRPGMTQLWCSERRPPDRNELPPTIAAGTRAPGWTEVEPKRRATAEPGPCSGPDANDGHISAITERR